ncbi:MAG TPA: LysE family transporter [Acetobacteraceae bacterium]
MTTLLVFWAAFGLAVASPGPNFAVILATATRLGRPAAVRTALGMACGEAVWGFAAVFGVAALAAAHPSVATMLRVGGGAILLYMGFQSLRAAWRPASAPAPQAGTASMARGFGLMLLNAKAGVFWVSITGVLIGPETSTGLAVAAVAGAVLISALWHLCLALAFSTETAARAYRRLSRGMDAALGAVLAGIGLRLVIPT